ncbi:hypothetical protein AKJ57_00995 [candidate division MSBL1 archaeon SCGC-AAA259A05]|uniref:Mandelate racemase/muconate lactonizing enzyme C-terminal domain-containing protein n=1 Tax=candidate division MSBL1 archaeon SCGC-AAA259A05 TaxID=1698259 RepID=A0A133UBD7_9EURY|nr:hypothetical protein AKJ57_00995 [candidate division MSBL1 archaeon SCGC-AAA259A05]
MPSESSFYTGAREFKGREFTIVKIFTDEGIMGIGCVPVGDPLAISAIIERKLKQLIIGEDPFKVKKIWNRMYEEIYKDRTGVALKAISAIDIALWDIIGKSLREPVSKLLGTYRDNVLCYVTGGYYQENKGIKELVHEVEDYIDKGFKAIKLKVGKLSIEEDKERVKSVRKAIGNDIKLAVDANHAYTVHEAIKAGKAFDEYDIWWFEEPVRPDNIRGNAAVVRDLDMPIATGEIVYTIKKFRNLIENEAVDIIQPDVTVVGGISEWMKIAHMASAWNIPVIPHWSQEISVHLVAAVPHALAIEFFTRKPNYRLEDKLYKNFFEPSKGYLGVPSKPGIGIELDEEAVNRFRIKD